MAIRRGNWPSPGARAGNHRPSLARAMGYLQHAREVTRTRDAERRFATTRNDAFTDATCFVATEQGLLIVEGQGAAPDIIPFTAAAPDPSLRVAPRPASWVPRATPRNKTARTAFRAGIASVAPSCSANWSSSASDFVRRTKKQFWTLSKRKAGRGASTIRCPLMPTIAQSSVCTGRSVASTAARKTTLFASSVTAARKRSAGS